jgi:hypothetical protein
MGTDVEHEITGLDKTRIEIIHGRILTGITVISVERSADRRISRIRFE